MIRVGVDVGGTFTDLVALDRGRVVTAKVPSTPEDQSIQTLPQRSQTWKPSARSQTTGGWPRIARGSKW